MQIHVDGTVVTVRPHPLTSRYAADASGVIYKQRPLFAGVPRGGETAYGEWMVAHLFPVRSAYTPPYLRFSFTIDKKRVLKTAHRFVLECFEGMRDRSVVARHRNDNHMDNRIENLCYGTTQENVNDAFLNNGNYAEGSRNGRAKLDEASVLEIRRRVSGGESINSIWANYPRLTKLSIKNAAYGVTWSHI